MNVGIMGVSIMGVGITRLRCNGRRCNGCRCNGCRCNGMYPWILVYKLFVGAEIYHEIKYNLSIMLSLIVPK